MAQKLSLENPVLQVRKDSYVEDKVYREISNLMRDIRKNFQLHADAINYIYAGLQLPEYTVSTVPSVSTWVRRLIYVSDEIGGAVPAFSDGTNWRRVTDRSIIA